jgi:hypothetical protein
MAQGGQGEISDRLASWCRRERTRLRDYHKRIIIAPAGEAQPYMRLGARRENTPARGRESSQLWCLVNQPCRGENGDSKALWLYA